MKKWLKVVLGCLVVVVLGVTCLGLGVSYGLFKAFSWGKAQVEGLAETERQIEELQRQANANEFSRPGDGRLSEDRLLKFLAVRRDVWGIYEKYKPQIEARRGQRQPSISDLGLLAQAHGEIRLARARAQVREGLSDEEYGFQVEQVYKTAWASEWQKGTGEQSQALDVPPENVALLRKHEAEIRKYAMEGLALIGL